MIHTAKGTTGFCKRCINNKAKFPIHRRLFSVSFRKKQYWLCADCVKELNEFITRY